MINKKNFNLIIFLSSFCIVAINGSNLYEELTQSRVQQPQSQINPYSDLLLDNGKCEPLNPEVLPLCKDIAYNETRFPNFMKQKSQQEAASETSIYLPLVRINCSPVLKLFLCSLYAPPCIKNYSSTLKPCREMCEKAKSGCEDFMKRFSYSWPDYIDCWRFPSFNGAEACITDENYATTTSPQQIQNNQYLYQKNSLGSSNQPNFALQPSLNTQQQQQQQSSKVDSNFLTQLTPQQQQVLLNTLTGPLQSVSSIDLQNKNFVQLYAAAIAAAIAASSSSSQTQSQSSAGSLSNNLLSGLTPSISQNYLHRIRFICPAVLQLQSDTKNTHYLSVNDEKINQCAMPCDNTLFERQEIEFARSWVLIWSSLCFSSTLFTILTFIIETSRFRYPERPIIFLSGCYMLVAFAYLLGSSSLTSNSIVCKTQKNSLLQISDYLIQGVEHLPCTILFMLIYFFSMASSVWWVVLTLTWFLAAGLKWGHEAIENISSYFHLAAWTIPGIKLIVILWLQKVDADILSGVCFTGIRNMIIMKGFVLAPLILYLILGTCFLLAGFVSLIRIRNVMKHEGNKTVKLEKFMVRIGVFSILYMVPAIIVICCYFYEQSSYNKWIDYWLKRNSLEFNLPPDYVSANLFENDRTSLVFSLFMVKYAMILVVGITSGFWIWSHKTISSWQRFFDRLFGCLGNFKPKYKNEAAV
jgi:hypothetical protein